MIRWKVCRKDWHLSGKRPEIGLCRKISNLYNVSSVSNVCLSFAKQVLSSITKSSALTLLSPHNPTEAGNFSCNNKTNYTRRHKFITHKNNCYQVFSRSRNDQPMFVNECKFKEGWQSSSLKNMFSVFRRARRKHLFSKSKPYSTTCYKHVSILTLREL